MNTFGHLLRDWRQRRRLTQLDLADAAGVSTRHVSFLETHRSLPSRALLMRLGAVLDMPLRERNRMLVSAGFAPMYREHRWDEQALQVAREAIERLLAAHEPYPALAIDRHWNLVTANAAVLEAVYRRYPQGRRTAEGTQPLSFGHAMLLLTGVFMVLLGGLLVPVALGAFPFSSSVQLGLLLILFAVQTLAAGETPLGAFPRTGPVVACGLLFALLGTISCLVPGLLVAPLTLLVGGLNVAGGLIPLLRCVPLAFHPLGRRLGGTQRLLNGLSVLFGVSMLLPGLLPGVVVGVVLTANGGVLLYLLYLLRQLEALAALRT